jgi:hypothetical protein
MGKIGNRQKSRVIPQCPMPHAQCPIPSVNTVFFVKMVLKSIEKAIFGSKFPY